MQEEATTIPLLFFGRVEKYGDRAALLCKRQGAYHPISWAEYGRQVRDLALGLISLGVEPGQNVALLSLNCPEWMISDLAILAAGGVNVPVHTTLTPKQIEYILLDSQCQVIIVGQPDQLAKLLQIRDHLPQVRHIIALACAELPSDPALVSFPEVMARGARWVTEHGTGELDKRMAALQPDGMASIIYTSGTTGEPKGVMLSHDNFLSNVRACLQVLPIGDRDLSLNFLPLSHVFARTCDHYTMLGAGGTVAFAESSDKVPANMLEVRPSLMMAVPRFYEKLYAQVMDTISRAKPLPRSLMKWAMRLGSDRIRLHRAGARPSPAFRLRYGLANRLVYRRLQERLGGRLRFFVSGGAPLPREIAEFFGGVGILICEGYGLTESSPIISVNPVERVKFGTVGPPIPGVEVKIAEDGEVLTRGPHIMKGYYGKEQDSAETIVDGWLHTGDVGCLDEDGYLAITDRKKDLIVTAGGKNVAPQPIENALTGPYISQALVIGDKRKFISALLVPNFDQLEAWAQDQGLSFASRSELVKLPAVNDFIGQYLAERMADFAEYEHVRRFVLMDREFTIADGELTPTMKLKRKVINDRCRDLIDSMYPD